jgi:hypothetical protein
MMHAMQTLANPAMTRALVIGVFGGAGLSLTATYSRRGPMIYPVYASLLAALTLLLSRFSAVGFVDRFAAALASFLVASAVLAFTVGRLARLHRARLVTSGRLSESALNARVSLFGYAWRIGFMLAIGGIVSAGVAFVAA